VGATLAPDPENRWGRGTRVLEQLESREPPAGAEGRRVPLYHNELPPGGRGEQALAIVAVRHLQRVVVDPGRVLSKAVVAKHDPTRAGWTQARPGPLAAVPHHAINEQRRGERVGVGGPGGQRDIGGDKRIGMGHGTRVDEHRYTGLPEG